MNILIVEDDLILGETLVDFLSEKGMKVTLAKSFSQGVDLFTQHRFDVTLIDLGLPDGHGLDLAKKWRPLRPDLVIIFVTAQNDPEMRVTGLEVGADDYITKPFALKELLLRLQRLADKLERQQHYPVEIIHGKLKIWFERYQVQKAGGEIVDLSQKECAILELLYRKKNQAVNREDIIQDIWGTDAYPSQRTVDNYIVQLRKWAESDKDRPLEIISIRGIGYKLSLK